MKIVLLCIGDTRSPYILEGMHEYAARIKHYAPCETEVIPEKKAWKKLPRDARKKAEGEAILNALAPSDMAVLLDENGMEYSSRGFAAKLEKYAGAGHKRLVFVIGGAFGFSPEVYAAVKPKMSLSKMTFNHEMVRLFMLEQIYRAFSILRNEPYHND
ncbi:MAG: 23S rRNA (pseudouridine(1915)-N(3))-methyltransferase RlmH [Cryomorphaceae bacterium]|nr:23S rRNA (pseudouridine(1915)-N(3))-methyltransferase RlmH [Flavobacteriales bacterium]